MKRHKKRWISEARKITEGIERQSCFICNDFKEVSEIHHLVPLSVQFKHGFKTPSLHAVWLCPTCHKIVHKFISNNTHLDIEDGRTKEDLLSLEKKYPANFIIASMAEYILIDDLFDFEFFGFEEKDGFLKKRC